MSEDEKLVLLTTMTGESNDEVLIAYLNDAESIVLRHMYPFGRGNETLPDEYIMEQINIAVYLLNKRGAEGETAHSENGVSRTYADGDIPASLLSRIVPRAGVL